MKKQVLLIHGGDPQESYEKYLEFLKNYIVKLDRHAMRKPDWQNLLSQELGDEFEVLKPDMPSKRNAKYIEWKIWFEKFFQFVDDGVILVGSSLGGTFLAKYLAENKFPKKVKALFLIAGAFSGDLYDFSLPKNLSNIEPQVEKIFLYQSKDDNVVPFKDVNKFKQALPKATVRVFEDRQHFNQQELPELVKDIKSNS